MRRDHALLGGTPSARMSNQGREEVNDRRQPVASVIVMLLLVLGCGSSNTVMIGISGNYVEVADGDSTQISVPRSDTNLPHYFQVRCPDGYVRCTVVLDNPPVEAKIGETARLTGRLEYGGETMYRFDVRVNVRQEPMQ